MATFVDEAMQQLTDAITLSDALSVHISSYLESILDLTNSNRIYSASLMMEPVHRIVQYDKSMGVLRNFRHASNYRLISEINQDTLSSVGTGVAIIAIDSNTTEEAFEKVDEYVDIIRPAVLVLESNAPIEKKLKKLYGKRTDIKLEGTSLGGIYCA